MPNRFVLVDDKFKVVYDRTGVDIQILFQDEGKTIKILLRESENAEEEKAEHHRSLAHDIESCRWPH